MRDHRNDNRDSGSTGERIFGGLFGLIPLGIGLTVIGFVWSQPSDGFGAMPVFFKIFATFIASAFVLVGGGVIFRALSGLPQNPRSGRGRRVSDHFDRKKSPAKGGYVCTSCGATLSDKADVSPSGDVKCTYCGSWFNIHHS